MVLLSVPVRLLNEPRVWTKGPATRQTGELKSFMLHGVEWVELAGVFSLPTFPPAFKHFDHTGAPFVKVAPNLVSICQFY